MAFLRSKIALVVLGALIVGGAAAMLGARSAGWPSSSAAQLAVSGSNNGSGGTGGTSGSPTATNGGTPASGTPTAGSGATPTNTQPPPTATATRVPPTPTPIPIPGNTYTFRGSISNINSTAQTFVLNVRGGSYTCYISSSTNWTGGRVTSFSGLQQGMQATVTGQYQGGGNLNPVTTVDAQIDN